MNMDDSKWARLFHLCAENQWHWKVRFVNDTRPYNEVIYEPMAVGRIAATTIRDGFEGPFYYKELVWVRVPNAVVPGACVGVRKLITIDLVKVAKVFQESGIPFTSSKEYVHVGQPEL